MQTVINYTPHFIPRALPAQPPSRSSDAENQSVISFWIQGNFCDATGLLLKTPDLQPPLLSPDAARKHTELLLKPFWIGNTQLTLGKYLRELQAAFPGHRLYLRGSYASYILNPLDHLKLLIDRHIEEHPETKEMMEKGWEALTQEIPAQDPPADADWALLAPEETRREWLPSIKESLIDLHAKIGRITPKEAKDHTFGNLKIAETDALSITDDPIVIATLKGELANDLLIGTLNNKPYLFTRDNRYIPLDLTHHPQTLQGCFWQGVLDHSLQIIRLEKWHVSDFRALMTAFKYRAQGLHLESKEVDLNKALESFAASALPQDIARAILHKIPKSSKPRILYLLQILSLLQTRREEIWQAIFPHIAPEIGCSQHDQLTARQFLQEFALYGWIPLPHEEKGPSHPVLQAHLKKQLLLHPAESAAPGPYGDWKAICSRLHTPDPFHTHPEELYRFVLALARENNLTPEEKGQLRELFHREIDEASLLDALLECGRLEAALPEWIAFNHRGDWRHTLETLLASPAVASKKNQLKTYFETHCDEMTLFEEAFRCGLFQPDDASHALFTHCSAPLENEQLTAAIRAIAPFIPPHRKLWLTNLWIAAYSSGKIQRECFQERIEKWMQSDLPPGEKEALFAALFHRFGNAIFTEQVRSLMFPLIRTFSDEDLRKWFKGLAGTNPQEAAQFFIGFQTEIEPALHSCLEGLHPHALLSLVQQLESPPASLEQPVIKALQQLPQEEREQETHRLPQSLWETIGESAELLTPEQRAGLLVRLLRAQYSAILLFKLEREKIHVPEDLRKEVLQRWNATQRFPLPRHEARALLKTLLDAEQIDPFYSLLDKLPPGTLQDERVHALIRTKCGEWLQNGSILSFISLQRRATLDPDALSHHFKNLSEADLDMLLTGLVHLNSYLECICTLALNEAQKKVLIRHLLTLPAANLTPFLTKFLAETAMQAPASIDQPERLLELVQNEAETLYHLYRLFPAHFPDKISPALSAWIVQGLPHRVEPTRALAFLACKGAKNLIEPLLEPLLASKDLNALSIWLKRAWPKLNQEEKAALLPKLFSDPLAMELLFLYLKDHAPAEFASLFTLMVDSREGSAHFEALIQHLFAAYFKKQDNPPFMMRVIHKSLELEKESALFPHADLILSTIKLEELPSDFEEKAKANYLQKGSGSFLWLALNSFNTLQPMEVKNAFHHLSQETFRRAAELACRLVSRALVLHRENQWKPNDYPELARSLLNLFPLSQVKTAVIPLTDFYTWALELAHQEETLPDERIALLVFAALKAPQETAENALEELSLYMPILSQFTICNLNYVSPLMRHLSALTIDDLEDLFFRTTLLQDSTALRYLQFLEFLITTKPEMKPHRLKALNLFMKAQFGALISLNAALRTNVIRQLCETAIQDREIDLAKAQYVAFMAQALALNLKTTSSQFDALTRLWVKTIKAKHPDKNKALNVHIDSVLRLCKVLFDHADADNFTVLLAHINKMITDICQLTSAKNEAVQNLLEEFLSRAVRSPFYEALSIQTDSLLQSTLRLTNWNQIFYYTLLYLDDGEMPHRKEFQAIPAIVKSALIDSALGLCLERGDQTAVTLAQKIFFYSLSMKGPIQQHRIKFEKVLLIYNKAGTPVKEAFEAFKQHLGTEHSTLYDQILENFNAHFVK